MIKQKGRPHARYNILIRPILIRHKYKKGDMRRLVGPLASASSFTQQLEYWKGWDTDSQISFYNTRRITYVYAYDLNILTPVVR